MMDEYSFLPIDNAYSLTRIGHRLE
jgi:hypothetical protein